MFCNIRNVVWGIEVCDRFCVMLYNVIKCMRDKDDISDIVVLFF